jgi:glucose repression mediator protein
MEVDRPPHHGGRDSLLAIRVVVAPLDIEAYSCNTLCLPKMIIEMGIPIIQIQTSTAVLGLALVQYHLPFNTVADLDLLCLASKATRHRSVNLLALRNPASSLLSVVHLPLTIAILVIQTKTRNGPAHLAAGSHSRTSESPLATPQLGDKRRRKERDEMQQPHSHSQGPPPPHQQLPPQFSPQAAASTMPEPVPKQRRKRVNGKRKEEEGSAERRGPATFKHNYPKGPGSPENGSNSGSSRSVQPSPTSAAPRPPSRLVDEDYDEGVAETLIGLSTGLASYRGTENPVSGAEAPSHSPTVSSHSRLSDPSPRPPPSHRNSSSSHHASPQPQPSQSAPLKRALSPGPEDVENNTKRTRVDTVKRRISSPSGGRRTPVPSTRPSPTPFRTQAVSHSPPEARDHFPPSPSLPAVLPPHPRPIGAGGHAQVHVAPSAPTSSIALPPIATLSPASTAPSPPNHNDRDDKMHVDSNRSSSPPPSRSKLSDVMHPSSSRSPPTKQSSHSQSPPSEKDMS